MPANAMDMNQIKSFYQKSEIVDHYASAAINIGLWISEEKIFTRVFKGEETILELGCGAGRIAMGLYELGYQKILGIDYSREMIMRARHLAKTLEYNISFQVGNATELKFKSNDFDGAIFGFNGLMQIPNRYDRRLALKEIKRVLKPSSSFVFTTHDRELKQWSKFWKKEKLLWSRGKQNANLNEYGDRFEKTSMGELFIHVPTCSEIREDLKATGYKVEADILRMNVANEPPEVREFSDECRFWVARRP